MMRPRQRGGKYGFSSGYCMVTRRRNVCSKILQSVTTKLSTGKTPKSAELMARSRALDCEDDSTGHEHIRERKWKHNLPSPGHKLVEARPGHGGAQQDKKSDKEECLDQKPQDRRQHRSKPTTQGGHRHQHRHQG